MASAKLIDRTEQVFVVQKLNPKGLLRTLLYRCFSPKNGEHTNEYAVELQFENKKAALAFLTRYNLAWEEISDVEEFPL